MKRVLLCVVLALLAVMPAFAAVENPKTLLIINSYHEDELWANRMIQPVELYLATIKEIVTQSVYLNNSAINDMDTYNQVCDNVFEKYKNNHPDYVVFLGNFAFSMRDRVVQEWGNIPMLLISRMDTYGPIEQNFEDISNGDICSVHEQLPIGQLRNRYNFSAVIISDFYDANIDLMMRLMPDMKEFVFISDRAYINKIAAMNLQSIMSELHPDVKFTWLQGDEKNRDALLNSIFKPHPNTGYLLSSWVYEVESARGVNVLTTKDLSMIPGSVNPIFTMRQLYMRMGCVGGAFADNDVISDEIMKMIKYMISGKSMKDVPFYVAEKPMVCVDYELMKKYHLDFKKLPEGAVIVNKPQTYLEKYGIISMCIFAVLLAIIFVFIYKNKMQRKQIGVLERHTGFVNNLPMPYTKATLWLNKDDNVININYDVKNNAYEKLITSNSMPDNPLHLFSNEYLSNIAHKLITTNEPMSIQHHFKRSGLYCYMIFVPLEHTVIEQKGKGVDRELGMSTSRLDIDVFAIDITKDHMMQQQLRDQAVTIDISMEMAQLVPWRWDAGTDTLSFYTYRMNPEGGGNTSRDGKSNNEIKFEDFLKMMPQTDAEQMLKSYHKILRGEESRLDNEFRMYRDDGSGEYDWCENHGVVTDTDSDGRPLRMTGSLQFITERKLQQEKMSEALTKAKESDMLKSAFLANMSHEIRTPLNAIVGFSNLLTNTDDIEERKEFAEIINRNNELLLSLINDILDLAKIESNTITLTYDLCDIHDVVDSIAKTVSIRVPKGVRLNVAHYSDSCIVRADASHVSQILINLLTNATKFTKRGSITVGYEIYEDENKLYFFVKDTGIGISKENIDKVFNRFVKLNNFVQGSGLGLAICRTLVEKMGGEIGVESQGEGKGSMFWFTIPYDPMELKIESKDVVHNALKKEYIVGDAPEQPAEIKKEVKTTKSKEPKVMTHIANESLAALPDGLTVLVAEDNPSNYWLISRLMQDKFELYHAENGQIAVDMVDEVNPDIIVMDINMPELDGYGAVEIMRKKGVKVPIIAVTAYAFASDRVRILNSGFDAFVSKPVSATILYDTINDVWDRKQMKEDNKDSVN